MQYIFCINMHLLILKLKGIKLFFNESDKILVLYYKISGNKSPKLIPTFLLPGNSGLEKI